MRTTVILVPAALIGVGTGVLAALAGQPVKAATLVGGGAAGAAIAFVLRYDDVYTAVRLE